MMWYWHGIGGGWMIVSAVIMVLFWAALIWLVIWAVRRATGHHIMMGGEKTPLDIAKERYARGEITKEQFEEIKRNLM